MPWRISGLALSTIASVIPYHRRAPTTGGPAGAILVGTIVFAFGGWVLGMLLVAFFSLSTPSQSTASDARSRYGTRSKNERKATRVQVPANGGLAAVLSLLYRSHPTSALVAAFLRAMAAVNADTRGTQIRVLSPVSPRLIVSGCGAPVGTSRGGTLLATAASKLGDLFIGLLGYLVVCFDAMLKASNGLTLSWIIRATLFSGLLGSLFDNLLDATVQGIFYCARCETETERGARVRTPHNSGPRLALAEQRCGQLRQFSLRRIDGHRAAGSAGAWFSTHRQRSVAPGRLGSMNTGRARCGRHDKFGAPSTRGSRRHPASDDHSVKAGRWGQSTPRGRKG